MINFKHKKKNGTCNGTCNGTGQGHLGDTNNNDNNIYLFNFKNNKEKVAPFSEGDEVSKFLKTKGINTLEAYQSLPQSKQDDLMEEWFFSNR